MCSLISWSKSAIIVQLQLNIDDHGESKCLFTASSVPLNSGLL